MSRVSAKAEVVKLVVFLTCCLLVLMPGSDTVQSPAEMPMTFEDGGYYRRVIIEPFDVASCLTSLACLYACLRMSSSTTAGKAVKIYFTCATCSNTAQLLLKFIMLFLSVPFALRGYIELMVWLVVTLGGGVFTNYLAGGILMEKFRAVETVVAADGISRRSERVRHWQARVAACVGVCAAAGATFFTFVPIPAVVLSLFVTCAVCVVVVFYGEVVVSREALNLLAVPLQTLASEEHQDNLTIGQKEQLFAQLSKAALERRLVLASLASNLLSYVTIACVSGIATFFGHSLPTTFTTILSYLIVVWQISSIFNDLCIAYLSGLALFHVPGAEVGSQSVQVWRGIAAKGKNAQECQELETIAFEVVSAAHVAIPSAKVKEEMKATEAKLLAAAVEQQDELAVLLRALAQTELSRLEGHMCQTWGNYTLLRFRCGALQCIKPASHCTRQPLPNRSLTNEQYLDWLYTQAQTAEAELDELMRRTLALLNECAHTSDIVRKIDGESELLSRYATDTDPMVQRSSKARRPYWKMGPRKARDRVLAKAANDYSELEAPSTSYVLDMVRCTGYFDDPMTLALCFAILDVLGDVVRVKNRFIEPASHGYRDMMLNIRLSNGHIAEIQLGFDSLIMLKEWMHPNYALARTETTHELIAVCQGRARLGSAPGPSLTTRIFTHHQIVPQQQVPAATSIGRRVQLDDDQASEGSGIIVCIV